MVTVDLHDPATSAVQKSLLNANVDRSISHHLQFGIRQETMAFLKVALF